MAVEKCGFEIWKCPNIRKWKWDAVERLAVAENTRQAITTKAISQLCAFIRQTGERKELTCAMEIFRQLTLARSLRNDPLLLSVPLRVVTLTRDTLSISIEKNLNESAYTAVSTIRTVFRGRDPCARLSSLPCALLKSSY